MPTRRQTHGRAVARNAHPRLRLAAAPLRQEDPHASVRRATDAGHRSIYLQFVRRLWLMPW
ncbi:MAG: hypothetical protein OXH75_24115 [Acidobacteria bacterium]|nr:hypothetical protein [Acidobacteriota bacterium]